MKVHLTIPSALFITLLTSALATGNRLLYMLAVLVLLSCASDADLPGFSL